MAYISKGILALKWFIDMSIIFTSSAERELINLITSLMGIASIGFSALVDKLVISSSEHFLNSRFPTVLFEIGL